MKSRLLTVASALSLLALTSPARAGLYLPAEPAPWPLPDNPKQFRMQLRERVDVKAVGKAIETLEKKRQAGKLSVEDLLNLGGYYILQAKPDAFNKAAEIFKEAEEQAPTHFMLLANTAAVYLGLGVPSRAVAYQRRALAAWPKEHPGWTAEQLRWYRRVEQSFLTLYVQRERESLRGGAADTLDDLFPGFRFVGPKGKYAAGELDINMRAKLPLDVMPLAEQMLLGMPHDGRLLWLFAELLNAHGEVALAEKIISKELVDARGFTAPEIMSHRRVLREALASDPRFMPKEQGPPTVPDLPAAAPAAPAESGWMPNWRQIAIGFGAGLLVGVLVMFQLRQIGRRSAQADRRLSRV